MSRRSSGALHGLHVLGGLCTLFLAGCSDPTPAFKPGPPRPPPPPLRMTQAEFAQRFEELALPVSASRIEYLFKTPRERVLLEDKKTPALLVYRCRDGDMWVAFGAQEGRYGVLRCQSGLPTDEERAETLSQAVDGAEEVRQHNMRQTLEQNQRRVEYLVKRLASNRDRILALERRQIEEGL